ncbi:hypothetical protein IE986_28585 [Klebsiella pneumoniae]|uniref:Uncharacterized protein n=1 Tax=Klebsiella pneumoniae TaxID=573 RepID=A0A927DB19_KLEPN|nr:hypothetical protein [Klebsiella pneumoniae]
MLALHLPLSLGSVQVGKGDLPDTSNPGSPLQLCPAPPPIFVRPGLGHRVLGADGHDGRQPFAPGCMVNLGASVSISARPVWGPRERTTSR